MTHKEKILQFVDYLGITKTKFCNELGFSNGFLDSKGAIGSDKLSRILENYRILNVNWLLLNEGEMINETLYWGESNEPVQPYGKNYQALYHELLEENRELNNENRSLRKKLDQLKKDGKQVST